MDDRLAGAWQAACMNLHPHCLREEKGGAGPQGQVVEVENGQPGLAAGGQQLPGLGPGLGDARLLHGPAGKVIILEVDQDES